MSSGQYVFPQSVGIVLFVPKLFKSTFEKAKCAYVPANVDVSDLAAQQHFLIWRVNTEISPQSGRRAERKCT